MDHHSPFSARKGEFIYGIYISGRSFHLWLIVPAVKLERFSDDLGSRIDFRFSYYASNRVNGDYIYSKVSLVLILTIGRVKGKADLGWNWTKNVKK